MLCIGHVYDMLMLSASIHQIGRFKDYIKLLGWLTAFTSSARQDACHVSMNWYILRIGLDFDITGHING